MQSTLRTIGLLVSTGFLTGGLTFADDKGGQPTDPMARMEHARELAQLGNHEGALKELLWCFDEGANDNPAFVGARLSFLLLQIAELGKTYPPALDALRERREAAEVRVKETKGTWNHGFAMMELASLNHSLGEDAVNLELYDQLRAEQPDSPLVEFLQRFVSDELMKAGRIEEAAVSGVGEPEFERPSRHGGRLERAWPRRPDEHVIQDGNASSGLVYVLDQAQFKRDLVATKDEQQRLDVLARRWNQIVLAVAYCDVVGDMSFHRSIRHWQSGWLTTGRWTVHSDGDLVTATGPMGKGTALVRGDCRANIAFASGGVSAAGGLVHVYGDLDANISVAGHSEIVIGGDIKPNGSIEGDGIVRIFVGGNVEGRISNKGSSVIWIHGDLNGEIQTGHPTTRLHVMGDFRGSMKPFATAALAYLDVRGSMSSEDIQATARHGWTEFNASIGVSDLPPGLYPKKRARSDFWVVHSQVQ